MAQAGGPPRRRTARGQWRLRPEGAGVAWDRTGFVEDGGRLAQERYDDKEYIPASLIGFSLDWGQKIRG
jgi:hypothetical protein